MPHLVLMLDPPLLMPKLSYQRMNVIYTTLDKRMAVVIDVEFVKYLGEPQRLQEDLSLCDLVWFVVAYEPGKPIKIKRRCMITLEEAVEWLTGGEPDTQKNFEARLAL